jgi:multiple sugar transport system permease protein
MDVVRDHFVHDMGHEQSIQKQRGSSMSQGMSDNKSTLGVMGWIFIVLGALLMLGPFYFMFVFATQPRSEIFSVPPPLFFGDHFLDNMRILMAKIPFWKNLGWSLYVGLMGTALTLLFCSMAGYAFAVYEFRFKKLLFGLVMGTMLVPSFLGMIPTFLIMDALNWIDQPRALYLPGAAPAMGIFMMRQYITSAIPKELIEAARMDNCGEFRIYWSVVVPLLGPAFGTLGLIAFIASWNNFIGPLVVLRSPEMYTFPLALRSVQSPVDTEWGALMAGSAIAVIPLLIIFIFSSRRLIEGLTSGAVRG